MNKRRNFALDEELISNVKDLKFALAQYKTKMIAYVDAAVYAPDITDPLKSENPTYVNGTLAHVFIKSTHKPNSTYSNNLVGLRGLKKCVYIDWFNHEKTLAFWSQELTNYLNEVDFDGLWTTMNEPYSAVQGELDLSPITPPQNQSNTTNVTMTTRRRRVLQAQPQFDKSWFIVNNFNGSSTYYLPVVPQYRERGPYDIFSPSLNATHSNFRYWNTIEGKIDYKNES